MSASILPATHELSVLSYNLYLLPYIRCRGPNLSSAVNQTQRAKDIAKFIGEGDFDIVGLQEQWGGSLSYFEKELVKYDNYASSTDPSGRSFHLLETFDALWSYGAKHGGLYCCYGARRGVRVVAPVRRHTYAFSNTTSNKGACMVVYATPWGGDTTPLLHFNTHLDHTNRNNAIAKQLEELHNFIEQSIDETRGVCSSPPYVLVTGDFNIGANDATMYNTMLSTLRAADLTAAASDTPTYDETRNRLTMHGPPRKLDYVLNVRQSRARGALPPLVATAVRVEQPKTSDEAKIDLSDHFPIIVTVKPAAATGDGRENQ